MFVPKTVPQQWPEGNDFLISSTCFFLISGQLLSMPWRTFSKKSTGWSWKRRKQRQIANSCPTTTFQTIKRSHQCTRHLVDQYSTSLGLVGVIQKVSDWGGIWGWRPHHFLRRHCKICCLNGLFVFPEYTLKLQSVEARCKILEKQLNHMRKMVENGNKEREAVTEKRVFQKSVNQKK